MTRSLVVRLDNIGDVLLAGPAVRAVAAASGHVVALCGEVFPVTKSAKPGSPVCPECKRIYEKLKA